MTPHAARLVLPFLFAVSLSPPACAGDAPRLVPLPVVESEAVLSRWLADAGFAVARTAEDDGRVRLAGRKGSEAWRITLAPHSPLASSILADYSADGRADPSKVADLWGRLDRYAAGVPASPPAARSAEWPGIPDAVPPRLASVVCLHAERGGEPIRFSGFAVSGSGLILSTAHDLDGIRQVTVVLAGGEKLPARLVRKDPRVDLSLIDVDADLPAFVPLGKTRDVLAAGEKVYSMGCPQDRRPWIHPGTVVGPRKQGSGVLVWQVDMETHPGSSGSPVFDAGGNLVGVVKGRYRGTDATGFLIPVGTVREFLK